MPDGRSEERPSWLPAPGKATLALKPPEQPPRKADLPLRFLERQPIHDWLADDVLAQLAALWLAGHDKHFAAALLGLVDAPPLVPAEADFSQLSRAQYDAELKRLESEIRDRRLELERRRTATEKERAEAELRELAKAGGG